MSDLVKLYTIYRNAPFTVPEWPGARFYVITQDTRITNAGVREMPEQGGPRYFDGRPVTAGNMVQLDSTTLVLPTI